MAKNNLSDMLVNPNLSPNPKEPQSQDVDLRQPSRMTVTVLTILSIVALALGGVLTYYLGQLSQQQSVYAQAFEDQSAAVNRSLEIIEKRLGGNAGQIASVRSRLEVTMQRVGMTQNDLKRARALAEQLKEEQARNVEALSKEIAQKAGTEQVASLEEEADKKFQGVNEEISGVKEEVKSNERQLTKTLEKLANLGVRVTEQGNVIATTATGLEELRREGERDYVTFDLRKKQRTRVAGIALELRKTDDKKRRADLRIYVDDIKMERKNIYVNTPINFYIGSQKIGYELVINKVNKNRIIGYVSLPKGKLPQGRPSLG
ncbi:hypothetical protein MYX78_08405 [Acidobacteria bacterium AH-259-G07]|nr:hypothetical protein [Acidobacteria bacterium AH-259-G07]